MEDFTEALSFCELSDLGARGPFFTRHNGQEGHFFTQERLDGATVSSDWCSLFPGMEVVVEASLTSDHSLLTIALKGQHNGRRKKRSFKYEAKWAMDGESKEIVKQVWRAKHNQGDKWHTLNQKLDLCKGQLTNWIKGKHGHLAE